jgi:hypothetical protein
MRLRFLILRLLILFVLLLSTEVAMAYEEPKYNLIEKSDVFELRAYKPIIIAEAFVNGDMEEASSKGFKLIADYIFGNNKSRTGASEKISMTIPVSLEPKSEKISMSVPVTMQESAGKWRMYFVMPSKYTLETLPVPNNIEVQLREVPAKKFAVVHFFWHGGRRKNR